MLTPDYYESCADDILKLYAQLEDDIISDIIRRMMKTGIVTESAKHQAEMLQNAGLLYDDILSEIAKRTDATSQHVKALFLDAGVRSVNFDNQIYRAVGIVSVDLKQSPAMRQTLEAGYRKTLGNMKNLTLTTANTAQNTYYQACSQAYMQVISGAFSYQEAIRKAVQKTAQDGAFVLYPSGHRDRVDVAVRRSVLTGIGQTCREIGLMNAEKNNCDLMEISAHFGARPTHAEWQGQIVSLSGQKGYLTKDDIGYGTGDGFGGWNCRHDWFPYFERYSTRNYSDDYLKSLNEKNIEYNGEKYSQYEISQIQRRYEREIRSAKREKVAFDTAVKEASDSELKAVMQSGSDYANQQIKDKQAQMRDFINQTKQDRDYFREQNYGRVAYPKSSGNDLTFSKNSGKINNKVFGKFDFPVKPLGENARIFKETYMEQYAEKFPKYAEALAYRFNNGNEKMQNLFLNYVRYDSIGNNSLNINKKESRFNPNDKKIYMNFIADYGQNGLGKGIGSVYFHEHGHLIDNALGNISVKNKKFYEALESDFVFFKKSIYNESSISLTYGEMCSIASEQFQNLRTDNGISDIISGLSDGNIKGCSYHDKDYWNKNTKVQEAFAHMFEAQFDSQKYQRMKSIFPKAFKEFENMLEGY